MFVSATANCRSAEARCGKEMRTRLMKEKCRDQGSWIE